MSQFRIRISAWIALTAYGLASFAAQLLHDHSHPAPLDSSVAAANHVHVAACPCGLDHGDENPDPADQTAEATLTPHAHSNCGSGHNHSHHHHHPSHDGGECPTCRYLAVKPAATPPVVLPELFVRIELTIPCVVLAPDVPAPALPSPRGPPAIVG